jgi:hypothetical protein
VIDLDLTLLPPVGGFSSEDLGSWQDFYNQITSTMSELSIYNDINFEFSVYSPNDINIHPQIEKGYFVLSIKYKSDVCDVKLSATQQNACKNILQYLFEQSDYNAEVIQGSLNSGGFVIPKNSVNLCCPDCGPMQVGYLEKSVNIGGRGDQNFTFIVTPFKSFLNILPELNCPISATASGNAWNNFNSNGYNLTQNGEFDTAFNQLKTYIPSLSSFGVGQYGSSNLLSQLSEQVGLMTSGQSTVLNYLLTSGLVVGCDESNYFVYTNSQYSELFY